MKVKIHKFVVIVVLIDYRYLKFLEKVVALTYRVRTNKISIKEKIRKIENSITRMVVLSRIYYINSTLHPNCGALSK